MNVQDVRRPLQCGPAGGMSGAVTVGLEESAGAQGIVIINNHQQRRPPGAGCHPRGAPGGRKQAENPRGVGGTAPRSRNKAAVPSAVSAASRPRRPLQEAFQQVEAAGLDSRARQQCFLWHVSSACQRLVAAARPPPCPALTQRHWSSQSRRPPRTRRRSRGGQPASR